MTESAPTPTPLPKRWGSTAEFHEVVATSKAWQRIYPVLIGIVATISIAAVTQSCYVSHAAGGLESDLRHVEQGVTSHTAQIEQLRQSDTAISSTSTSAQSQILIQLGRMEARMDTQFADMGRRLDRMESMPGQGGRQTTPSQ